MEIITLHRNRIDSIQKRLSQHCRITMDNRDMPGGGQREKRIDYSKAFNCVYYVELWNVLKNLGASGHLIVLL